jgi:hypothetical protein
MTNKYNRWRLDTKLTAMMVEDFIHDPILAAKVILRLRIPPHQQIRMMWMWTTYYTQDDSGFSTGKSTTHAIIIALRSILFHDRISGIVSGTFRQGKLIFQNFDKWYNNSPIFRNCIKHHHGQPRISHGSEAFEIWFKGGSICRALPPNFYQNSERLKSERWNDGYFDEWTIFDMQALTKTLFGRVTSVNEYQDCPIRQNHIHLCGTPGFKSDPGYKLVEKNQANIASGNKNYGQFTCNYRHIPNTKEWKGFSDRKTIYNMQTMNPEGIVKSEVDGIWQDDSLSFYSALQINDSRKNTCPALIKRQYEDDCYVAGFDSARGGSTGSGKGDDFALTILRIRGNGIPAHVHTTRLNNVRAEQMAGAVHKAHRNFQLACIIYDPSGGGLFVKDELEKSEIPIDNEVVLVTPIIELLNTSGVIGDPILIPFKRGTFYMDQMWGKMASESIAPNRIHRLLTNAISDGKIILAPRWSKWDHIGGEWDIDAKRDWLNKAQGLSELQKLKAEMDLTVSQLVKVDVNRNKDTGVPIIDKYGMYKFGSKKKKDSAYSLVYAYYAYLIAKKFYSIGESIIGGDGNSIAMSTSAM